ncbi:MAG: hypothetical protein ABGX60_03110 [Candidatus Thioglobus sp.]
MFTPKGEAFECLQYLITRLDQLDKMRSGENSRLQASLNKTASKSIRSILRTIDKQTLIVEAEIESLVSDNKQAQSSSCAIK